MVRLLIKRFISNSDDVLDPQVRKSYGVLCGVLGVICNFCLFVIKFTIGIIINSLAVITDAFNNLSDLGSSLISVSGAWLSGKRADAEHPYGHGRAEYISALIIAMIILVFGFELLKSSISGIINPSKVTLTATTAAVLVISIFVKLWMWRYNNFIGKKIDSSMLIAASKDSLGDIIATSAVVVSAVISRYVSFPVDECVGLCVSVMIMWTGVSAARDTIDRLMGRAPSDELIDEIEKMLTNGEYILGMHDLMVHDYGPGRKIASVHAEVSSHLSITEIHSVIDEIEHKILDELGVDIVIHMDPVDNE